MPAGKTSPNQKSVIIHKENCDKEHIYSQFNRAAMEAAMKSMNGREASGFLLWCYLSLNQEGYELALSNVAVRETTGMSKDASDPAVRLLIEKGYLVQRSGNKYDFYQVSQKEA